MNKFESVTKPLKWFIALLMVALVVGCGGNSTDATAPLSSAKSITSFSVGGVVGTIDQTAMTVALTVPNATPVTAMVATFTVTGGSVSAGTPAVAQVSATTANDFTSPVTYTVTAADGSTASYAVTVTVAAASAKAITAYSLSGITGTIVGSAISVTMPFGTDVTALVATFTTTGSGVTVAAATQTSGTTANDFTAPVIYTVSAADSTTATYTVTVAVAANSAKAITAYSFGGYVSYPGVITEPAHTIAVSLPSGTNVTALIASFTSTGTGSPVVGGVSQVSGTTANDFSTPKSYTVTAADSTTAIYVVTVTLNAVIANPTAPVLGEAGRYVILASQGITGGAGSALTNGDIAVMDQARTFMTGFTPTNVPEDGLYNELTGQTWAVELSRSYASADANPAPFPAPLAFAAPHTAYPTTLALINQSRTDLGVAYTFLAADPNPGMATQVCPTELGNLTLTPGVYKTASNVLISTGTLTLDAQGDANAVWIFTIDGTFTTGAPGGNIAFVGGVGSAKNVYWRVAGVTTIGANTTFHGNVFGYANVDVLANANITGSLYSTTASVTLITDVVTKAP